MRMIRRANHECFCPFLHFEKTHKEEPLYPGYVFVEGPEFYYLKTTEGVLYVLMQGVEPAFMPTRLMFQLLEMVDDEGLIVVKRERFKKGQLVVIKRGPLQNQSGVYITASRKDRVRVLMRILGAEHEVEFPVDDIGAT